MTYQSTEANREELCRRLVQAVTKTIEEFFRVSPSAKSPVKRLPTNDEIFTLWVQVVNNQVPLSDLCWVLLSSGWDFTDPNGRTDKSPMEIKIFLQGYPPGIHTMYADLTEGQQRLLNTCKDTYLRWLHRQR